MQVLHARTTVRALQCATQPVLHASAILIAHMIRRLEQACERCSAPHRPPPPLTRAPSPSLTPHPPARPPRAHTRPQTHTQRRQIHGRGSCRPRRQRRRLRSTSVPCPSGTHPRPRRGFFFRLVLVLVPLILLYSLMRRWMDVNTSYSRAHSRTYARTHTHTRHKRTTNDIGAITSIKVPSKHRESSLALSDDQHGRPARWCMT